MAKIDCDKIANMLATWLIAGDDDLAKLIADISLEKRVALSRANWVPEWAVDELTGLSVHELDLKAQSADIKLRAIVQAKILTWEIKQWEAYEVLVKQINKEWGSLSDWISLLNKLKNASASDLRKIVKLWNNWEIKDISATVKEIQENIANFVSSNYSLREYVNSTEWVKNIKSKIRKGEITAEEWTKQIEKLKKDALKKIKEGKNPSTWLAKIDEVWTSIKKAANGDTDKAFDMWSQYILAKEMIADWGDWMDDKVFKAFMKAFKGKNFVWDLTFDELMKIKDLDVLLSKAYLNTKQLCEDWALRQKYRERLIELSSNKKLKPEDSKKIESLINTLRFAEEWATFSKICEYNNLIEKAKQLWYKTWDKSGKEIYQWLKKFMIGIWTEVKDIPDEIVIAWIKFKPQDVVQLIYSITKDKNILKILNNWTFTDDVALGIATQYFLGNDSNATRKIVNLFTKAKDLPKVTNTQDLIIKTITWYEVKEWAPKMFYNFRDGLYIQDELNRTRANFMEQLTNQNKMRLPWEGITDITEIKDEDELVKKLKELKGWYLIVNDVKYRDNVTLRNALYKVNKSIDKEEDKIKVLFPKGAMMGNFRMEWGDLIFRTIDPNMFDDIAATISIQSLWEAKPTRAIKATTKEMLTGKNNDKLRYQASYTNWSVDSTNRQLSDQQYEYFKNSKVRDENGNLIRVYHWTGRWFNKPDVSKWMYWIYWPWMYFSTDRRTSEIYAEMGWSSWNPLRPRRVIESYLDIRNPITEEIKGFEQSWVDELEALWWSFSDVNLNQKTIHILKDFLMFIPDSKKYDALRDFKRVTWYDWIHIKDAWIKDWEDYWVIFEPQQVKNADNTLPTDSPDIRYQVVWDWATYKKWKVDSLWREVSDEQDDFFIDSAVKDENWNLIPVYHWTQQKRRFSIFNSRKWNSFFWGYKFWDNNVIYFTSDRRAANSFATIESDNYWDNKYWNLYECYLNIKNPLVIDAQWNDFLNISDDRLTKLFSNYSDLFKKKWDNKKSIAKNIDEINKDLSWLWVELRKSDDWKAFDIYELPNNWQYNPRKLWWVYANDDWKSLIEELNYNYILYDWDEVKKNTDDIVRLVLASKSNWLDSDIDWIIIKNVYDTRDPYSKAADDYIVFNSNQIKDVNNRTPTDRSSIKYQKATDDAYQINWRDRSEYYALPTEEELDDYLSKHDIEQELKDLFWTTDDPKEAMFITKDWEFINWYWLPKDKYKMVTWFQVEHWWAMQVLFFWDRRAEWWIISSSKLWNDLLSLVMWKTWLIRLRPWNHWYMAIQYWKKWWITNWQRRALWKIVKDYNDSMSNIKSMPIESSSWSYHWVLNWDRVSVEQIENMLEEMPEFKYFDALVDSHNKKIDSIWERIKIGDKITPNDTRWQRTTRRVEWEDVVARDAVNAKAKSDLFKEKRTLQEIADYYNLDIKYVEKIITPEWVKAYWAYWDGIIYLSEMIKESTVPHEIFHAVFDMVDKKTYNKILKDAQAITWLNAIECEEELADAFAHYFNTWEFKYLDDKLTAAKLAAKKWAPKSLVDALLESVKDFFKSVKSLITWIEKHQDKVKNMFDDMINCKYTPRQWEKINRAKAMIRFDSDLERSANKYFGTMLWLSWETIDAEYMSRVRTMLSDKLWIPIQAFETINDRAALWKMVDDRFALEKLTAWKYDKQMIDIGWEVQRINSLSNEALAREISEEIWDIVDAETIANSENIDAIRDTFIDYMTSPTAVDNLQAKGRIISLANGWEAKELGIDKIKSMFANWTFESTYRELFFPDQKLSPEDMENMIRKINDNMFDTLSIQFANNLTNAWYTLPLVNIKSAVYDYLNWTLDINSDFVAAFFSRNKIDFTKANLDSIFDNFMPSTLKFNYEDVLYKIRNYNEMTWTKWVFRQVKNSFVQDSYSSLAAISSVRQWRVPQGYEWKILKSILDKYQEAFRKWLDKWLDFQTAQGIKQEASYALDMFEQDFIYPKYGRFLTNSEKQWLMGMKYSLPIAVSWMDKEWILNEIKRECEKIEKRFDEVIKNTAEQNDINMAVVNNLKTDDAKMNNMIKQREKALMEQWAVIKDIGWEYVVVDAKQVLKDTLVNLPRNIKWFEAIKHLPQSAIDSLSNQQVYILLKYAEAAKTAETITNYATELMYKQNPMLLRYWFFTSYKINPNTWIPRALNNNLLSNNKLLAELSNTSSYDEKMKKSIFEGIKGKFNKQGYVKRKDMDEIINKVINDNIVDLTSPLKNRSKSAIDEIKDMMLITYRNAFAPYQYLRDIPSWWEIVDWLKLTNVKWKINSLLKKQIQQVRDSIKEAWIEWYEWLERQISIVAEDWTVFTLEDAMKGGVDRWKKDIFNNQNTFVKAADEVGDDIIDPTKPVTEKQKQKDIKKEIQYREKVTNDYNSTLQTIMNHWQVIDEGERKLSTSIMHDIRTKLRQYSLTNKLVDSLDILSWTNEEAARWIKDYLIWFMWQMTFWSYDTKGIVKRLRDVQEAYSKFYPMNIASLNSITPTSKAEDLALKLAKYFKQLENQLGSVDWLTWVTTKADINRAFYHIWKVFLNLNDERWVFSMLSAIEQNQILKFFKFANPNDDCYVKQFIRKWKWVTEYWGLWGYRDYVEDISWLTVNEFNDIFGSAFSESDFKQILQWLTWFTLTGSWWRWWQQTLNFLWGSHMIFRILMSYPWQLLTIPQQGIAYFLKFLGNEDAFWIESMSDVDAIREQAWVLNGAYNEIRLFNPMSVNPDDVTPNSFYNRYWLPDVGSLYWNTKMQYSDDVLSMYAKIDEHAASSNSSVSWWFRQMDPYKDNANNIIDGLFARNFKNVAFAKALRENDFMQFWSAKAFKEFMEDPTVSQVIKDRALDRISASAWRNFRNILWLWFGWIDRPIAWSTFGNIMYGLMQLFNFRWAWWQTIFRQTWEAIMTWLKMAKMSSIGPEGKTAIAKYIANRPEFMNFVRTFLNDMEWCWRLSRYQDNGKRPEDDEFSAMDYLGYMAENLNMASQWWQGIQSFGPARPFIEAWRSAIQHKQNPTVYKDTYWLWAFFNNLGKNFGRQWKVQNWIIKALWALTTDGWWGFGTYVENEFWKLSFWSLRYMMDEQSNSYWLTYETSKQSWWIPAIMMWEANAESDKVFSYDIDNTETWETMKQLFNGNLTTDEKWTYFGNLMKSWINASQLSSIPKNVLKVINRNAPSYYTDNDLADVLLTTEAWKEFYSKGYVTPRTVQEAKMFVDTMLANGKYRPGSSNFNKSITQFDLFWHMNGKEKGNENDKEMEFWLEHMKYQTEENWSFAMKNGEKVVDPNWTNLMKNLKIYANDSDYVIDTILKYSIDWLNNHSSDPNYQLYIKLLGQWQAVNLIEGTTDKYVSAFNDAFWLKKDARLTETELKNAWIDYDLLFTVGNTVIPWEDKTLFDKLQVLDEDAATAAALWIIQSQVTSEQDKKTLEKFFNVKQDEDTWEVSVTLRNQYKSQLTQLGSIARAMDEGNVERVIAEASSITKLFMNEDPTWAVTASLLASVINRTNQSQSLSSKQKIEIGTALFHDNKEFIQRNADKMREVLWSDYDIYANYMNDILYQWDWDTLSNLWDMQAKWEQWSWWKNWWTEKALKLSSNLKSMIEKIWWKNYWWNTSGWWETYKQWVPVKIAWASLVRELWLKGYVPDMDKIKIVWYTPQADFSIGKDVTRKVSNKGTQQISSSKTLSKIEGKIEKASEGE